MSERKVLSVSLHRPVWEAFCAKAAEEHLSPSSVLNRLIKEYLGLDRHGQPTRQSVQEALNDLGADE